VCVFVRDCMCVLVRDCVCVCVCVFVSVSVGHFVVDNNILWCSGLERR
jgi:hypothetical protein